MAVFLRVVGDHLWRIAITGLAVLAVGPGPGWRIAVGTVNLNNLLSLELYRLIVA
jgi:hypothetical protein